MGLTATWIMFVLSCLSLSLVVGYGTWVSVRVWIFRQQLFQLRDRLWERMFDMGELGDSGYQSLRKSINGLIELAPAISTSMLWVAKSRPRTLSLERTHMYRLSEVAEARRELERLVTDYIMFRTLSGFAWYVCLQVTRRFGNGSGFTGTGNGARRIVDYSVGLLSGC